MRWPMAADSNSTRKARLQADLELVSGVLAGNAAAQDAFAARLREPLERAARHLVAPDTAADLVALAMFEILQAERRILTAWGQQTDLDAYLAVVAARVCLSEIARWALTRPHDSIPAVQPVTPACPDDKTLARLLSVPHDPPDHAVTCPRCIAVLALAREAGPSRLQD